jgi:integrase
MSEFQRKNAIGLTPSTELVEVLAEYSISGREKSRGTVNRMLAAVSCFKKHLGHEPTLGDITNANLSELVSERRKAKRSENTIAGEIRKLLTLNKWAAKKGGCDECDYLPPNQTYSPPRAFTEEELRALAKAAADYRWPIANVPGHLYMTAFLAVLFDTAERYSAVVNVKWEHIDTVGCRIQFVATSRKGGRMGKLAKISERTAGCLNELKHWQVEGPFIGPHRGTIHNHWRKLVQQAGLDPDRKLGTHAVRRSHASYLKVAGGDATASLGHATDAVTRANYFDPRITEPVAPHELLPNIAPPERVLRPISKPWWKLW